MKRVPFTIGDAVDRLLLFIEETKKDPKIKKPISWALYQAWKWFDEHELERDEKQE